MIERGLRWDFDLFFFFLSLSLRSQLQPLWSSIVFSEILRNLSPSMVDKYLNKKEMVGQSQHKDSTLGLSCMHLVSHQAHDMAAPPPGSPAPGRRRSAGVRVVWPASSVIIACSVTVVIPFLFWPPFIQIKVSLNNIKLWAGQDALNLCAFQLAHLHVRWFHSEIMFCVTCGLRVGNWYLSFSLVYVCVPCCMSYSELALNDHTFPADLVTYNCFSIIDATSCSTWQRNFHAQVT